MGAFYWGFVFASSSDFFWPPARTVSQPHTEIGTIHSLGYRSRAGLPLEIRLTWRGRQWK